MGCPTITTLLVCMRDKDYIATGHAAPIVDNYLLRFAAAFEVGFVGDTPVEGILVEGSPVGGSPVGGILEVDTLVVGSPGEGSQLEVDSLL